MLAKEKDKLSNIKYALITGASSGIGLDYCHALAKQGVNLVIVARDLQRLNDLAAELRQLHKINVLVITQDLSDANSAKNIFQKTQDEKININLLINNAGYADVGEFLKAPWQEHNKILSVMLCALVELCHLYLPQMLDKKFGAIINVGSIAGIVGFTRGPYLQRALYRPIKSFVINFTEQLDKTYNGKGVSFQCLCPGLTYSEFHKRAGESDIYSALPKIMWMDSISVVNKSINCLFKPKKIILVTGIFNKFAVFMWKLSHLFSSA